MKYDVNVPKPGYNAMVFDSETMVYTSTHSDSSYDVTHTVGKWQLRAIAHNDYYVVGGYFGIDNSTYILKALNLAYGINAEIYRMSDVVDILYIACYKYSGSESCIYLKFDKHNFTKLCMITDVKLI